MGYNTTYTAMVCKNIRSIWQEWRY